MPVEGQLIVRPYRPSRIRLAVLAICVLMLVVFAGGYVVGSKQFSESMQQRRVQSRELDQAHREASRLRQSQSNLQLALQVDMATLEQVRKQMTELQSRLVAQENELSRYRSLLGDTGKSGLYIDSFSVRPSAGEKSFEYSLVIRQVDAMIKTLDVTIDVTVAGRLDNQDIAYSLADLDPKVEAGPIKTRFKYFKVREGTLSLPEGFEPDRITIVVTSSGKKSKTAEATFSWHADEE